MRDPKPISILYENESFLAADKPAGVLTIPGREGIESPHSRPDLRNLLQTQLKIPLWVVHRLDFEVSGLILFAKNAKAHSTLSQAFENRKLQKTYEAWTHGTPPSVSPIEWHSPLARGKKRTFEAPHGKPSTTRAIYLGLLSREPDPVLQWRIEPLTGRSHQIRVHLSQNGYPIVGDALYGSKQPFLPQEIALRAVQIDFPKELAALQVPSCIQAPTLLDHCASLGYAQLNGSNL